MTKRERCVEEAALLARLREGDEEAFRVLLKGAGTVLTRPIRRLQVVAQRIGPAPGVPRHEQSATPGGGQAAMPLAAPTAAFGRRRHPVWRVGTPGFATGRPGPGGGPAETAGSAQSAEVSPPEERHEAET